MRTILASVVLSTATAFVTVSAQASPLTDSAHHHASYCPRRDAYEVSGCLGRPRLPNSPVTPQLHWMLRQLSGDAATVTADQVRRHFTKPLLAQPLTSADDLVAALRQTLRRFGPMHLEGFSYPPRQRQALMLARGANGFRAEVPISVTARTGLINYIAVSKATPVIVPRGRLSGWFDIGGRRLFMRCTGRGSPTVVFENGLTSDWYQLQNRLSSRTRVCSYDPARQGGPTSRSASAPAPRTGSDRVHDLHSLLAIAHVPGPYVLAAHSNGGLFSLLYASRHPRQVAGLVLIDGVHPRYHRRTFNALKQLIPPSQWPQAWKQYCAIPPLQADWEQMDICRSEAQAGTRLAEHPLGRMPLAVIRHGVPEGPPGPVRRISERVWRHLQRGLAALEPGSDYLVARRSGHDIQHTQPLLVLREVRRVVSAVRAGRQVLHGPTAAVAP